MGGIPESGCGYNPCHYGERTHHVGQDRIRHRRLRDDRPVSRQRLEGDPAGPRRGARQPHPRQRRRASRGDRHPGVSGVRDGRRGAEAPGVDAVIITTPSGAHREPALAAAAAGKHVVVEKPLEITRAALRGDHRRLRPGEGPALHHLPVALRRRERHAEERGRGREVRPADPRRDDLQVVARAGVLRRGRLEGDAGPRRRRGADEPGHPQRRSAPVDDGARGGGIGLHRDAGPRAHRGRGHGRRGAFASSTARWA